MTPTEWICAILLGLMALWAVTHPEDVREATIWIIKDSQRAILEERQRRQSR